MEETHATTSIKKVVIVGPECTGKSTLASLLAKYYNTSWVPEYARLYIDRLERPYEEKDLPIIARGQLDLESKMMAKANKVLICDTDLTVIKIWSEHKYGACYDEILKAYYQQQCDLYLLTDVDLPWENDPQRENPHLRQFFYDAFKTELQQREANYVEISGDFYFRQKAAVAAIDDLLTKN